MKSIFLFIIILILFIRCSDNIQPTESEKVPSQTVIIFGGNVLVDSTAPGNNIVVKLLGDTTYIDTTDLNGKFKFTLDNTGIYSIVIEDSSYFHINFSTYIYKDTSLTIYLTTYSDDFFPLNVGNWWEYRFDYRPDMGSMIWKNGTVKWEIKSIDSADTNIIYHVGQTVNARIIDGNNPYLPFDTSYVKDEFGFFDLVQDTKGFISFTSENYFNRRIKLKRFYETNETYITLDYGLNHVDSNLVAIDREFHKLTLKRNVGIEGWVIRNSHNGGPRGELKLVDYQTKD